MNPDREADITGRLAALELLVAQALSFGLAPIRSRADLIEELKKQHHARLERLPADARTHAIACNDRVLYAGLAIAEQIGNARVG